MISIIRIISGRHALIQFFPLLDTSVPERLWQRRSHRLQQGSIVTPCPAVGPSVSFFVEHRHRSPFSEVFSCSIYLLSTSNNGSIPQTTWKMTSLSQDILCVVDLGHLESFVGIILGTKKGSRKKSNKSASESMCNMSTTATCSVTSEKCSSRTLIHPPTPLMITGQHAQCVHVP